jgi:hypothetical protein
LTAHQRDLLDVTAPRLHDNPITPLQNAQDSASNAYFHERRSRITKSVSIIVSFIAIMASFVPAAADNIVVEEMVKISWDGQSLPPQFKGMENLLEELNVLSIDDYRLFPFQNKENSKTWDRFVLFMKGEGGRNRICAEAQRLLFQMGAQSFRRHVLFDMLQSVSTVDEKGTPKITAEAVVAFQTTKFQFECVRPF